MRVSASLKRKREAQQRAGRQAAIPMPNERPQLRLYYGAKPFYIAVCKHGYGIDAIPAVAIARAQTEIPLRERPSPLFLYEVLGNIHEDNLELVTPTGFDHNEPQWPNGTKPRLVGLTTTHSLFKQAPR